MGTDSPLGSSPRACGATQSLSPTSGGAAAERDVRPADRARRQLVASRARRSGGIAAGQAVRLGAAARGGRQLLAGDAGRARPDRGRGRAVRRGRARARPAQGAAQQLRLRTNLDEWVTVGPAASVRLRRPAGARQDRALAPYVEVRAGPRGAARARGLLPAGRARRGAAASTAGPASACGARADFFALDEAG